MILYFSNPVLPQSIHWFTLDEFVHKICRFVRPFLRQLFRFDLLLPTQHVRSDFLPVSAILWPPAQHHFLTNHPECVLVHPEIVVVATHDFRRHLPRSPGSILAVFFGELPRYPHVSEFDLTIGIHY